MQIGRTAAASVSLTGCESLDVMGSGAYTTTLTVDAPAKVNLALHITGQRCDGYHELDSLVVFCTAGDQLKVKPAHGLSLSVAGPFGAVLSSHDDNLVLRAAHALRHHCFGKDGGSGAVMNLVKNLPVAGGIGGGSADAAAAFRALNALWRTGASERDLEHIALPLGADVPVCLASIPRRMSGIGEVLAPLPPVPPVPMVLVNPGVPLPTAKVFQALDVKSNPGLPEPAWGDHDGFLAYLSSCRNDLEAPACRLAPVIPEMLSALRSNTGCLLARMSGSGPTVFGLFSSHEKARKAAGTLHDEMGWWTVATDLLKTA